MEFLGWSDYAFFYVKEMVMFFRTLVMTVIAAGVLAAKAERDPLGFWSEDGSGLPTFKYTEALPYKHTLSDGTPVDFG